MKSQELEAAWRWREERGILRALESVRVFHGPGEGSGELSKIAVDRFGEHFWVTNWGAASGGGGGADADRQIAEFLESKGARSAVIVDRPEGGGASEPRVLLGQPSVEKIAVGEDGCRFWIKPSHSGHPGLFLDHLPLRQWLRARMEGLTVLNTFAYTGSLSVAAGLGGARHVTTLDLSGASVSWARENWELSGLEAPRARFIAGDVFEWLPRLKREGALFDCVILDPPSFSRGKKGTFSTAKDLGKLHEQALAVLAPGGYLVSSINSAGISREKMETEIRAAAQGASSLRVLSEIGLPETFPTRLDRPADRYLKGFIFQRAV